MSVAALPVVTGSCLAEGGGGSFWGWQGKKEGSLDEGNLKDAFRQKGSKARVLGNVYNATM